ncbi:MAG: hypothetical protein AB8B88_07560 [Devosiaceae bacterium]
MRTPIFWYAGLVSMLWFGNTALAQNDSNSPEVNPSGLTFNGVNGPRNSTVPSLVFRGIAGPNSASISQMVFRGWPPLEPVTLEETLTFEGWADDTNTINTDPLAFAGWGGGPRAAVVGALEFSGWGDDLEAMTTSQLVFTGLGPTFEITETFDGSDHGWTANDGPDALEVSGEGALCVRDFELGDVTLAFPRRFLGDWGAGSGTLSFRVYYTSPIQWPAVVTLRSPYGHAVWRPSLGTWNDRGYSDVERSLDDIWWEYVGDFGLIRRTIGSVEIVLDLKDGSSGDIEACIDDVVLKVQPID